MTMTVKQLETLTVYVPPAVAKLAYEKPHEQPGGTARRFYAATAFADISGFTPLAEKLAVKGVRGAEELTAILNRVFKALITTIEFHGGQVVKFGGDALSLIWPCEPDPTSMQDAVWRAAQAAVGIQATMIRFATVSSRDGDEFSLQMKIGLSAGELLEVHAGGEFGRWEYVLAGAPMANMSSAENLAEKGEIIIDQLVWELLHQQAAELTEFSPNPIKPYLSIEEVTPGFHRLLHMWDGLSPQPLNRPDWVNLEQSAANKAAALLRCYIPGAINNALEGGQHGDMLAELKPMTVCFVGFSGIDYVGDKEAGPHLSNFMRDAQKMIYHYEGSVNKLAVGDKGSVLLVLFGAPPFFHEDDEVRGVACALALLQVAERHNIQIQVGLTAGPLFAGPLGGPQRREYTVIGDMVNLAARLMQKANVGEVYVDSSVQSKAKRFFEYEDLGRLQVKGKTEPRHAFKALGDKEQDREEQVMGYLLSNQELTGRDKEVMQFDEIADKAWQGQGQILLLAGEAGVGKSRLLAEFVRRWMSRGGVSYGGDCVSYGKKTPYLPWRGIISSVAGLSPRLTSEQRANRLQGILYRLPEPEGSVETSVLTDSTTQNDDDQETGYWIERLPLVAQILGLEVEDNDLTRAMPDNLRRDNVFATIQTILIQESQTQPALIIIEDTHWSDTLSLDLATHISGTVREQKLLILMAHRPLDDARSDSDDVKRKLTHERLQELAYSTKMLVNELSPESSLKLVQNKLGVKSLPPDLAELIKRKGQGNPFFIEELVNSLLETGTVIVKDESCHLARDLNDLELPDTVQKVVLTRIDRLDERVKVTLKVAAAIGRHFQRDLLAAVHPWATTDEKLNTHLKQLQAEDFTRQEVREDDLDFLFKHVITQEVAYETMLYSQRRQLHTTIGTVLEERYAHNEGDEYVDLLAHHYSRSDNRLKALEYLNRAGQRAIDNYASEAAIGYFCEAIVVTEELNDTSMQFSLLAGREQAYNRLGNRTAQAQDLEQMHQLALGHDNLLEQIETGNRRLRLATNLGKYDKAITIAEATINLAQHAYNMELEAQVMLNLGITYWRQGNYEEARKTMQALLELDGAAGTNRLTATSLNYLGLIHTQIAEYEQARQDYQQALQVFRAIGDKGGEAGSANNLGLLESSLGRYQEARHCYSQALGICQTIGDRLREGISLNTLGQVQTILGDYEQATQQLERSLEIRRNIDDRRGEAFCLHDLGYLLLAKGDSAAAIEKFEAAVKLRQILGEKGNYVASLAAKGEAHLAHGDIMAANVALGTAITHLQEDSGSGEYPPQNIWWAHYLFCHSQNNHVEAIAALKRAYQLVRNKAELINDPSLRISYLERVRTNAKIIEAMVEFQLSQMDA
ncbi:tetratricopeptide repeat protein [Anaerolineales bacterium HSG6]|nr:tetratricopeptide repeat protein [Anaerolineales bacterium HSG6]